MLKAEQVFEVMRWKPQKWQLEFIEAKEKELILNCGRKAGKTTAECIKAACMLENSVIPGEGLDGGILILSKGQRQAKEIMFTTRMILERCLGYTFSPERNRLGTMEDVGYATTTELKMPNGNRMLALPCGYDAASVRPYSFHAIFYDEADYLPFDVFVATQACAAVHDAQRILASTPAEGSRGTKSFFYKAWHDPGFRRWEVPTRMCPHVTLEFLKRERRRMTKHEFEREYECKFVDSQEGLFRGELIAAVTIREPLDKEKMLKENPTYLGIDFARFGKDDNVVAYCSYDGNRGIVWQESIRGRHRLTHVTGRIRAICQRYPTIRKVITDSTGMGSGPTDSLIEALGRHKIIGIDNHTRIDKAEGQGSRYAKEDLYTNLIRLMESGRVMLDDDIDIVRSLRSMRYKYTETGKLSIHGHYSHIAEAVVRAVFPLMIRRPGKIWISFG